MSARAGAGEHQAVDACGDRLLGEAQRGDVVDDPPAPGVDARNQRSGVARARQHQRNARSLALLDALPIIAAQRGAAFTFTQNGANPRPTARSSRSSRASCTSQASSSASDSGFASWNAPIMPAALHAPASCADDTRNMGACSTGRCRSASWRASEAPSLIAGVASFSARRLHRALLLERALRRFRERSASARPFADLLREPQRLFLREIHRA